MSVERQKAYKYQSLAGGFRGRKADPFIVIVEPKPADAPLETNTHMGQEFDMVWEGRLELTIGGKKLILEPGDSIYFDANSHMACVLLMVRLSDSLQLSFKLQANFISNNSL